MSKIAIIIGAGPAGLTAALELLQTTNIKPIIIEKDQMVGGLARTIEINGYRMDIGGHRFFSPSPLIEQWWQNILPHDFLTKNRRSRIFYNNNFFDYPITLRWSTFKKLGIKKVIKIGFSYLHSLCSPIRPEKSLKDFYINRFGRELYQTFFESYTEKVWGVPCNQIQNDWGAQRVKGLSIGSALINIFKTYPTETSLIDQFHYPRFGPGQMWQAVADKIISLGGEIIFDQEIKSIQMDNNKITAVITQEKKFAGDYFFSSMPIRQLITGLTPVPPDKILDIATHLPYRGFITIGILVNRMLINPSDNWLYIQDPRVKLGRIQIFNNWSEELLMDKNKIWLGLEYFADEGDEFWQKTNEEMAQLAIDELVKINFINPKEVVFTHIEKIPQAYPAYFGAYKNLDKIKSYLDPITNLFLIGRNGQHLYGNMDTAMLSALEAVKKI